MRIGTHAVSAAETPPPSRQLHVDFTLKYLECDLADERVENKPVVKVFLSSQFERHPETGGVLDIALDEHHLEKEYPHALTGTLKPEHASLSPTAAIGICSYASHFNENGHRCYVNVGTTHAFLGDIVDEVRRTGTYDHSLNLLMRTTVISGGPPVLKGKLELRVNGMTLGPGIRLDRNGTSPLQAPMQQVEASLSGYIRRCVTQEEQVPDTLTRTERIRAPMDISQEGIETTGDAFLPIAALAMMETPRSNPEFFRNAFQVVLDRQRRRRADYYDYDLKEKARTMGLIMCHAVQSFDYIGDAIERGNRRDKFVQRIHEGTEDMGNAWDTLADDCESDGRAIQQQLQAFRTVQFDPKTDPELVEMQQLSRQYVPMLTLAVVHGAKIGDQEGRGAHMYDVMVPNHQFRAACGRTAAGREFLQRAGLSTTTTAEPQKRNDVFALKTRMAEMGASSEGSGSGGEQLPPLFFEGTGHIDCRGYDDPMLDQKRYIAKHMSSVAGFKREIPRGELEPSPFYLADLAGVTAEFVDNPGVGAFIMGQQRVGARPGEPEMTRGVMFSDRHADKPNFALMPQPNIPDHTMRIIRESIALRPPPRDLILDHSKPMTPDRHRILDQFVKSVKGFGRKPPAQRLGSVDVWMRPHQFNADTVSRMIGEAAQLDRIYDAEYATEHITNDICVYRLSLFVK